MTQELFRINPALQQHIDPLSEEELKLLEESILAEGVRDPLVVWKEENVLVDGHNRKSICDKHSITYSVIYRSFSDIQAAKAWMDLNQLGRRNLSKEKRNEMIKRLAADGVRQKEIAEKVGLSKGHVSDIVNKKSSVIEHLPDINSTTAKAELESKQQELDKLRREFKQALQNNNNLDKLTRNLQREVEELRTKTPEVVVKEKIVEKPVIKEVLPLATEERLKLLEKEKEEAQRAAVELRKANKELECFKNIDSDMNRLRKKKERLYAEVRKIEMEKAQTHTEVTFDKIISSIEMSEAVKLMVKNVAEEGTLTEQQVDRLSNGLQNLIVAAKDALIMTQAMRSKALHGGGLRVL